MEKAIHHSTETRVIRQRMREVRRDLDEDVQDIVESAREIGDWRSYVKAYPWSCLGAAMTVGYLIAPRRRFGGQPDTQTLAELAKQSQLLATSRASSQHSVRGLLLPLVGNLVMRGVSSFVAQQAGRLLATQPHQPHQAHQDDPP